MSKTWHVTASDASGSQQEKVLSESAAGTAWNCNAFQRRGEKEWEPLSWGRSTSRGTRIATLACLVRCKTLRYGATKAACMSRSFAEHEMVEVIVWCCLVGKCCSAAAGPGSLLEPRILACSMSPSVSEFAAQTAFARSNRVNRQTRPFTTALESRALGDFPGLPIFGAWICISLIQWEAKMLVKACKVA